jgi:hypothetical protein
MRAIALTRERCQQRVRARRRRGVGATEIRTLPRGVEHTEYMRRRRRRLVCDEEQTLG